MRVAGTRKGQRDKSRMEKGSRQITGKDPGHRPTPASISFVICELGNKQAVSNTVVKIKWENTHEVVSVGLAHSKHVNMTYYGYCQRYVGGDEQSGGTARWFQTGPWEMTALLCVIFFPLFLPYVHSEDGVRPGLMIWKTRGSPPALLIFIHLWGMSPHPLGQFSFS